MISLCLHTRLGWQVNHMLFRLSFIIKLYSAKKFLTNLSLLGMTSLSANVTHSSAKDGIRKFITVILCVQR